MEDSDLKDNDLKENKTLEKMKVFWSGFGTGILVMLTCLLGFIVLSNATGLMDWQGLLMQKRGSVLNRNSERKLKEIQAYMDRYFLDDIDEEKMETMLGKGAVAGLQDTYAAYYDLAEYADMKEKTYGNYVGIGAYVGQNATTGAITITAPIPGSPAKKAGLQSGDVLAGIDGHAIEGMDLTEAVNQIKGKEGTKVKLAILRGDSRTPITITIIRRKIESQTVSYRMLDQKIGYIAVSAFEDVTREQFRKALNQLEKKGEKALIIDLRDNGGGLLQTAVDMLDRMLPKGVVVYTLDKRGKREDYTSDDREVFDKPVAILVNGNSASASEVFSGAMQDYGRAVLVGEKTFGKGIVQSIFDLSDGTALKLTTARYYTPKGRCIHGKGLTPDLEAKPEQVSNPDKNTDFVDNQMQVAVDYLARR